MYFNSLLALSLKKMKYSYKRNMKRNKKECLNGTITKRRKAPQRPLCNLPVDVLSHILSQLPINDAIRTSVLSRKWKNIWRRHTNLTFDSATMRKHYFRTPSGYGFVNDKEFIERVDTVLHQHSGVGVERMEVNYSLHKKHADHIDRWVTFAVAAKAKELIIDLSGGYKVLSFRNLSYDRYRIRDEPCNVPSQLFSTCSYLKHLELTSVSLQLPADFIGFLNLKHLTLVDVSMTDEDAQRMLSGCHLLKFLKIAYCRMVTSIKMPHPMDQLKHLVVDNCPLLQEIELNCSPTTLEYTGTEVPFVLASTSKLKSMLIKFMKPYHAALWYIVTRFPSTLRSLETLTLHVIELQRPILPGNPFKFTYLRHLRLELVLGGIGNEERKNDALYYAYLLEVAPFIEKLELLMFMTCRHQPYHKKNGKLRNRTPHQHAHLKFVRISGFFGHKDQVELALYILRSSVALEKMEITPKVEICYSPEFARQCFERTGYVDGHSIATEFVCKEDHRNVVEAIRASVS